MTRRPVASVYVRRRGPAGEGVYVLTRTGKTMHLAYALELPEKPGPVQKQLNIEPEASFALSIKNPEKGSPRNTGLDSRGEGRLPGQAPEGVPRPPVRDRGPASAGL